MILADTTVWIDHFRSANPALQGLLANQKIVVHSLVVSELALGSLRDRARTLQLLDLLPHSVPAHTDEVRQLIEAKSLYSKGIGLVDAQLIASCLLTAGTKLWSRDASLQKVAASLGILFDPQPQPTVS